MVVEIPLDMPIRKVIWRTVKHTAPSVLIENRVEDEIDQGIFDQIQMVVHEHDHEVYQEDNADGSN